MRSCATWADVQAFAASSYRDATADADLLRCRVVMPAIGKSPELSADVEVRHIALGDTAWLIITAIVGSFQDLSASEMLGNNVRTAVGAFCTRDGALAVRQVLPLDALQSSDLDDTVRAVAHLAAFTKNRVGKLAVAAP